MSPTEFKKIFFDRLGTEGILYVSSIIGDMDAFLEGLTIDDWTNMTASEWEAFLVSTNMEDLVEFIHDMHAVNPKVVYDMFMYMPTDMLEDFKEAKELSHLFSVDELETIGAGVKRNIATRESQDVPKPKREDRPADCKRRRGGKRPNHGNGQKRQHNNWNMDW